jgi:hypothetical protein
MRENKVARTKSTNITKKKHDERQATDKPYVIVLFEISANVQPPQVTRQTL